MSDNKKDDSKKSDGEQNAAKSDIAETSSDVLKIGGHGPDSVNIKNAASQSGNSDKSAAQSSPTQGRGVYLLVGLLILGVAVGAYFYFSDKKKGVIKAE